MPLHGAFPVWIVLVFVGLFMVRMLRIGVGGGRGGRWDRIERADREGMRRLEDALAERDVVIDDLQRRLSEMESRLDFTERLLTERGTSTEP
ncbi:MAG TPA: hypothetical protein VF187_08850 [Gemmatimonadales bacterium]